jgi:hypothetical protein
MNFLRHWNLKCTVLRYILRFLKRLFVYMLNVCQHWPDFEPEVVFEHWTEKQYPVLHALQQVIHIYCFQTKIQLQIKIFWERSESELLHIMQGCSLLSCLTVINLTRASTSIEQSASWKLHKCSVKENPYLLLRNPEVNTRARHWSLLHEASSILGR